MSPHATEAQPPEDIDARVRAEPPPPGFQRPSPGRGGYQTGEFLAPESEDVDCSLCAECGGPKNEPEPEYLSHFKYRQAEMRFWYSYYLFGRSAIPILHAVLTVAAAWAIAWTAWTIIRAVIALFS